VISEINSLNVFTLIYIDNDNCNDNFSNHNAPIFFQVGGIICYSEKVGA
jgi:hypothetical protein